MLQAVFGERKEAEGKQGAIIPLMNLTTIHAAIRDLPRDDRSALLVHLLRDFDYGAVLSEDPSRTSPAAMAAAKEVAMFSAALSPKAATLVEKALVLGVLDCLRTIAAAPQRNAYEDARALASLAAALKDSRNA